MSTSGRRILAGLFWLLASLGLMVSTVVVWAHQSLLTTGGWTRLVGEVFDEPEVIEGTADTVIVRVSDAIGLDEVVARVLPGESSLIAGLVTVRVEDWLADRLATVLAREDVQAALGRVNAAAHEASLRVIRGGGEIVGTEQGTIALDVFPLVESVLVALQEAGFIDAARQIPDLSEYQPPEETVARLEALLGRDLPDDIGTIELVSSDRLAAVQQGVRAFDVITIAVLLVTAALIGLALWLSNRRLRMVAWLAVGAVAALALGRGFTRLVVEDIGGSLADQPGGRTVRAAIEAAVDQVMWVSFVVIAVALVVAGVALWLDRRRSAEVGATLATDVATPAEPGPATSARPWLDANRRAVALAGLGVIGFLVVWRIGGPDIALLAAAATGAWLIIVNAIADRAATDGSETVPPPAAVQGPG